LSEISDDWLPMLEALADERIGGLPAAELPSELAPFVEERDGVARLAPARLPMVLAALRQVTRSRSLEWVGQPHDQGEILDAFARHCRDELDEVELLAADRTRLTLGWRRERATVELRAGTIAFDRLGPDYLPLLLTPLSAPVVTRLAEDQRLAARVAVCDLVRLEKVNAVRSSVFVYFEWFLRDAYGVKLLPSAEFTRALVARGVLSMGMG
jgi:hypothetical protein